MGEVVSRQNSEDEQNSNSQNPKGFEDDEVRKKEPGEFDELPEDVQAELDAGVGDPKLLQLRDGRHKLFRVTDPADPMRCGNVRRATGNQCMFQKEPGSNGCRLHGGRAHAASLARKTAKLYDLAKYRARLDRLEGDTSQAAIRLTEELGILRMALESLVQVGGEVEFVSNAPKITMCVREIRETLKVDRGLAREMGELMDRAVMARLCEGLVTVISKYVAPEKLDHLSGEVAQLMANAVSQARGEV